MQDLIEQLEQRRRAALDEAKALGEAIAALKKRPGSRTRSGYADNVSDKLVARVFEQLTDEPRAATTIGELAGTSATTVFRVAKHHPELVASRRLNGSRTLGFYRADKAREKALAVSGD